MQFVAKTDPDIVPAVCVSHPHTTFGLLVHCPLLAAAATCPPVAGRKVFIHGPAVGDEAQAQLQVTSQTAVSG